MDAVREQARHYPDPRVEAAKKGAYKTSKNSLAIIEENTAKDAPGYIDPEK